ncbi:PREDICTED: methylmalonic aciduria type A protein, mitochondrial-like [Rhagoletis zephyria]|uniref:methylmalonic aciduria type A protein, mitochondrial-like n=1 Tax=Rhagoletis zephyria TaxID=28612 RepID=UPI0008118F41|nr:PREDICTED: methylmalonic aciduria type A protein, mitochondrial-like [Rhagoletis zephyria]
MPMLTKSPSAFIRPSPSRLHMGGVTQATGNSILACETAGYDVIIVETVGVGQSEYEVAHLCDIFTLLVAPAAGDELQAIKKGIVEMANVIAVTKFDGDLIRAARRMRGEIKSATKYIDYTERPAVLCVSAVTKEGIEETWRLIEERVNKDAGLKAARRQEKRLQMLRTYLINELFEVLSRNLSYEQYEERLKADPTLSLSELVQDIIYRDLYKVLQKSSLLTES